METLDGGKIPLLESGTLRDISPRVPEPAGIRDGIEPLECGGRNPLIGSVRPGVRIADEIRAVAREAGDFRSAALRGNSVRIVHGERRTAHEGGDAVDLPVSKKPGLPIPAAAEERKIPLIADDEAMARVEHGAAVFGGKIKGILRKIV